MSPPHDAGSAQARLAQAVALFRAGRMAECEAALAPLVAAHPAAVEALELLGATQGAQGRAADALATFERACALKPGSHTLRHSVAQALFHLRRLPEARAQLEQALALEADYAPAWNLLGSVHAALGDARGAERAYRRAIQAAPEWADVHYNLAHLFQQSGRLEESIACYRRALQLRPAFAAAHNNLANALKVSGRAGDALAHYAEAVRLEPGLADAFSNYGTTLRELGRFAEAVPLLERAAMLKRDSAPILNNLGIALFETHRAADAVACYRRALALRPDFHEARNNLANALATQGLEDEAIAVYREVLAMQPGHPDAYSNLGLLLQERGALAEAIELYRKALALQPDHSNALSNLGYLLQEQGRMDEAIGHYRRALEANPASARAGYNLGMALIVKGELAEGWALHELRYRTVPPIAVARTFAVPALTAEEIGKGGPVAVWPEQGVGDQLLYSTLLPELAARGQPFVVEVDRRLVRAFRRSHPDWTVVGPEESARAFAECTRHIAVGSLPLLLRPDPASFGRQPLALLAADAERAAQYRARLGTDGVRNLAISWRSYQPRGRGYVQRKKSAALDAFDALSRRPDLRLVDVQYGDTKDERAAFTAAGGRLARFEELDLFNDLEGVLAVIAACDAVVTTSNVTAHFGGILGKPTFLVYLAGNPPFHYWVPRPDGRCYWYPSVRVVTGRALDTWPKALARVDELLRA